MRIHWDKKKDEWVVEADPHVLMRFERMFHVCNRGEGFCRISNNEENVKDLYWFNQRFEIPNLHQAELEALYNEYKAQETSVQDFLNTPTSDVVADLALPLREYQNQAVELLRRSKRILLGDDLGLGKTASAIGGFTLPGALPALVVTATHLTAQWEREVNRFAPHLTTHVIKQKKSYDITIGGKMPDVIIISYFKLDDWHKSLVGKIRYFIADEVQELRSWKHNAVPKKYRAAQRISERAEFFIGTSATPIYNYGGEFYSVMNAIRPGFLGNWREFFAAWCRGSWDKAQLRDPKAFGAFIRKKGVFLRRTRSEVNREIPMLQKIPHMIEADLAALDSVSDACAELARLILSDTPLEQGKKMQLSTEFSSKLRHATGVAKAAYIAEFVKMLLQSEKKIVLFLWHRDVYDIVLEALKDYKPVMYSGTESPAEKEKSRIAFMEGDARVMLMSLRSGPGLDGLQHVCRTVVFGELDWSSGAMDQGSGRVHRDGQRDPVVAYYLMADSGIDPIMSDVLGVKRHQVENVKDPNLDVIEQMVVDEDRIRRLAEHYLSSRK